MDALDQPIALKPLVDPGIIDRSFGAPTPFEGHARGLQEQIHASWLTFIRDASGLEHAVLSDGWHHLRLDVAEGSLSVSGLVLINYAVAGLDTAWRRLIAVRRFLDLVRNRRFSNALYPPDPRIDRWLALLRVHDALRDGAGQREIGKVLFGEARVQREWYGPSDSLRSRIRRLVRDARAMARGGYRTLLQRRPGER